MKNLISTYIIHFEVLLMSLRLHSQRIFKFKINCLFLYRLEKNIVSTRRWHASSIFAQLETLTEVFNEKSHVCELILNYFRSSDRFDILPTYRG